MKRNKKTILRYTALIILLFTLLACSEGNDNYTLSGKCKVSIEQINFADKSAIATKSASQEISRVNAPRFVKNFKIKAEHLDNSDVVYDVEKDFIISTKNSLSAPMMDNIVEGRNKFTLTAQGGNKYDDWHAISMLDWRELTSMTEEGKELENMNSADIYDGLYNFDPNNRSKIYAGILEKYYPQYYNYKAELIKDIRVGSVNYLSFQMKNQNVGRFALVVEHNDKYNRAYRITINGKTQEVYSERGKDCYAYILNSDDIPNKLLIVEIEKYKYKHGKWRFVENQKRYFVYNPGMNYTRLLLLGDEYDDDDD